VKMEGSGGFFGFGGRVGARVRVCTGGGCGSSAMVRVVHGWEPLIEDLCMIPCA
jgi:hypothetical protein